MISRRRRRDVPSANIDPRNEGSSMAQQGMEGVRLRQAVFGYMIMRSSVYLSVEHARSLLQMEFLPKGGGCPRPERQRDSGSLTEHEGMVCPWVSVELRCIVGILAFGRKGFSLRRQRCRPLTLSTRSGCWSCDGYLQLVGSTNCS